MLATLPQLNGHVFNARTPVLRRDLLPAARIYIDRDHRQNDSTIQDLGYFRGEATLTVAVTVEAGADPALTDRLDQFCAAIETLLLSDSQFRHLCPRCDSIETTVTLDDQAELRTAEAEINFALHYSDCAVVLDLDDFSTLDIGLDFIDPPADPNTDGHPTTPPPMLTNWDDNETIWDGGDTVWDNFPPYHGGYPGSDGRIELRAVIDIYKHTGTIWDDGETTWDGDRTHWDEPKDPHSEVP